MLHACDTSPYQWQISLANRIERLYHQHNHQEIKKILLHTMKFKFIIDKLDFLPDSAKMLEIGCSQGYVTAYYLSGGYDITGTDISEAAVSQSRKRFGDHFLVVNAEDPERCRDLGQFDVIFSIGTVGCVDNPVIFINNLLGMLKPGGMLLFNCPDLQSVTESDAIWADSPPPDVITLFPETFWQNYFSGPATIEVTYEPYDHRKNVKRMLSRSQPRQNTSPRSIWEISHPSPPSKNIRSIVVQTLEDCLVPLSGRLLPRKRLEYGQFITMVKKRE
jgi:SAM-dependent methyltransferase